MIEHFTFLETVSINCVIACGDSSLGPTQFLTKIFSTKQNKPSKNLYFSSFCGLGQELVYEQKKKYPQNVLLCPRGQGTP